MQRILQKIITLVLLSLAFVTMEASESIIILSQETTQESIEQKLEEYQKIIKNDNNLLTIQKEERFRAVVEKFPHYFILKLISFQKSKNLIFAYLILKESFPKAFILEDNTIQRAIAWSSNKGEADDQLLWIAIFSLALIGILGLFSSSLQIKNIIVRHTQMQDKQNKIEAFLTNMGENIYSLSKKILLIEKFL